MVRLFTSSAAVVATALLASSVSALKEEPTTLQVGIKYKVECDRSVIKGDRLKMHYTGYLWKTQEVFDSSVTRGDPFEFTIGRGQVIGGWDQGILGMCPGDKRKLQIPSSLGYGARGSPPKIPADATLVFDVELLQINAADGNIYKAPVEEKKVVEEEEKVVEEEEDVVEEEKEKKEEEKKEEEAPVEEKEEKETKKETKEKDEL